MNKLFILIGRSCSGKDSVFNCLLNDPDLQKLKVLKMYTTRPKRKIENDNSYNFVTNQEWINMYFDNEFIEYRMYDVYINNEKRKWYYATAKNDITLDQNFMIASGHTIYSAYEILKEYPNQVIPIYLYCQPKIIFDRACERKNIEYGNIKEICQRFINDDNDYKYFETCLSSYLNIYEDVEISKKNMDIDNLNKIKINKFMFNNSYVIDTSFLRIEDVYKKVKNKIIDNLKY